MSHSRICLLLLLICISPQSFGQRIKDVGGDFNLLRQQQTIDVRFDYGGLTIGRNKQTERAFLDENIDRLNEKRAGKGASWAALWQKDKSERYEPAFCAAFEAVTGIHAGNYPDAAYVLTVHVRHWDDGGNIVIAQKSAVVDVTVDVTARGKAASIAHARLDRCKGEKHSYEYAATLRLAGAFAAAGEAAGSLLHRDR